MNASTTLTAVSVSAQFTDVGGSRITALDDVSAMFMPGQLSTIVGASGSGKSTLLHALAGILLPQRGNIRYGEHVLSNMDERQRDAWRLRHCGMVFQDFRLIDELDALSNTLMPARFMHWRMPPGMRERGTSLLHDFGVPARSGPVARLSRGEQQRVALARALLLDPPLLLADEPTASLDRDSGHHIASVLEELAHKGRTVIAVTHDDKLAMRADQRLTMRDGRLLATEEVTA